MTMSLDSGMPAPYADDVEPRTCCSDPKPRVHDLTGRFFCLNCRQWLDRPSDPSGDSGGTGDARYTRASDQTGDHSVDP